MAGRKNNILVPEAREGLDRLKAKVMNTTDPNAAKYEAAQEQGIHFNKGYNGDIKAKDAGKVGGSIGGSMVRELVKMAEQQLKNKNNLQ
nr:alpha/beta-type small acid-soluble spore protein [Evansella caseinilytica]